MGHDFYNRTFPNVQKLQHGGTYSIRTYRLPASEEDDARLVKPAFKPERLHVQRDPKGRVCSVTTMDRGWAETDPRTMDYSEERGIGTFAAEDYALEIELGSIN
jgi:hypothetical protein